ncbi:MAG TPA: tetratricopeptide repeat protein [Nitrospira sp.]|nr:tetratricopeptide repeat protein [Nitrospira sp.]
MALNQKNAASAMEIDRLATQLAKDPHSKAFLPLAEEYCKVGMWEEAVGVLEDGLKHYPGFITAMVVLGRAYDQLKQPTKARAVLEGAIKLSPDNLRAHRTLIKIYAAHGMTEEALKSCRVILGMNPRDEEALSVQASLGVQAEPEKPKKKVAPVQVTTATRAPGSEPPAPSQSPEPDAEKKPQAVLEEPAPQAATDASATDSPISVATNLMEQALHENDHQNMSEQALNAQPETTGVPIEPSSKAETIAQLEAWLRSIERQRRDRKASGDPSS